MSIIRATAFRSGTVSKSQAITECSDMRSFYSSIRQVERNLRHCQDVERAVFARIYRQGLFHEMTVSSGRNQ